MKVIECGSDQLFPLREDLHEEVCPCCGEVDPIITHRRFEFKGAFCPSHKQIHYRWIPKDWEIDTPQLFVESKPDTFVIKAEETETGHHRFYTSKVVWNIQCAAEKFLEVQWSGFDDDIDQLLRPLNTGYRQMNVDGAYLPFLSAIFEWLQCEDQWDEFKRLVDISNLSPKEKEKVHIAISHPTASNVFKMLWTFHRLIPDWNPKRKLGRRSPSALLIDELLWTVYDSDELSTERKKQFLKYGPEEAYWGAWKDIVPVPEKLNGGFTQFKSYLPYIGLVAGEHLTLVTKSTKNHRSWTEVAQRLFQWESSYDRLGKLSPDSGKEPSFVGNFIKKLSLTKVKPSKSPKSPLRLLTRLPICWMKTKGGFELNRELLTQNNLEKTLISLEPWIEEEDHTSLNLRIKLSTKSEPEKFLVESFKMRLSHTSIKIELIWV